jgi:hypothetical protein
MMVSGFDDGRKPAADFSSFDVFADVANDRGKQFLPVNFNLRDGRFNGKFFAIHPQRAKRRKTAHRAARDGVLAELTHVLGMYGAKADRQKSFQWRADRIGGRATKHLLRCRIEHGDALLLIHRNNRVHCGIDDTRQSLFTSTNCSTSFDQFGGALANPFFQAIF